MNIAGKNIILTGASSGIGQEVLKRLITYPDIKIIAVSRHVDTIPVHPGIVFPFSADLSCTEEIDKLFEYAIICLGRIDIFIANAGYGILEEIVQADWQHIERIYSLNTFSPIYSLQKLVQASIGEPQCFVCTLSAASYVPLPYYSLYCSTKAALHQFIRTYRYEAGNNLQLTMVYPVATRTDFFDKSANNKQTPLPWPSQSAEHVARALVRGIEKKQKEVYPYLLFRLFSILGDIFPFIFTFYSTMERNRVRRWKSGRKE